MRLDLIAGICLAIALGPVRAQADPPADLDEQVASALDAAGSPGMAITIVEDGKVVLARGYGSRRLGSPAPVDADTLFPTASTGKAFTAAALALLVDEGLIEWDDPVIDHMPWFQMYDPWVTREITIRDLLVHRSGLGLGAGDLLFVPRTRLGRRESVERLRHLRPATSFRSGYAYDNVLYMVAGQLIEEVTGQTWEAFVRDRLLRPAGMTSSTTQNSARFAAANRAFPHARLNGPMRGLGDQVVLNEKDVLGENAAPAGNLAISARDMGRWLQIQLARGAFPDGEGRLFSAEASREMWTPQTLMPIAERPAAIAPATPQFLSYALGWEVRDWRGHKIVWHAGADFGFRAVVVLIPDRNTAFSILLNAEEGVPVLSLMYGLLDHYLDEPPVDWPRALAEVRAGQIEQALTALEAAAAGRVNIGPSLPPARYAGAYRDPWYGPVSIALEGDGLTLDFQQTPGMVGDLEHWQYETFVARWRDPSIEPAYVTFSLDAEGRVERMTMAPVSPLADFSYDYQDLLFTPVEATP